MCPACGAAVTADQKFCPECGTRLALACPTCGAAVVGGQRFCAECGGQLTDSAAASGGRAAPVPERTAERRLVTVLFADLVGFTTFAEGRDAELVRETLSHYFERSTEVIDRYGGTVEKFIGDAVMAVWGVPVSHEDDAERSVRAALELVDMVMTLGPGIQARAGVLSGEAAVTLGAVNQGMVAGDIVNTAARLQAAAAPGTVLVGEATKDATRGGIVFEEAGEQALKGKAAPVAAWRAVRVVGDVGGTRRADALEAPFTGRGDELRMLKEQFHATGRDRRVRLVSLVGQAGIGKSRLAWELEKYLDGVVEPVRWHRGRSPSYGEGVTFWALGEMVRRRAGLAEGDDPDATRRAVAAMVAEIVPDETERRWIEPRMLGLLGVDDMPAGGREELFSAWRTFIERLAATGTVVLVFEDIHWADDGQLDFIEHLLDWSRNQPIFVVTLARPELLERRPGWGTDRRGAVAVRLDPLGDDAMRELLAGLAPGLPQRLVTQVLARADGIPLYAVETIRMLVGDGRLVPADGGTYAPAGDLGDLAVPATLHSLVAARLDGLPPEARSLAQVASVLGQSFTEEALAAVSGMASEALGPILMTLRRRELLALETDPRSPARGQHAFVQSIVREVAYGTLARKERRGLHLAAARYFESLDDDELAGVLATHHLAAWRVAPEGPEGEAAAAQARVSLGAAADRAESLGSLRQAADWLRAALEVTTDPADRARLLSRRGYVELIGAIDESGSSTLAQAVAAWDAVGDRPARLSAVASLVRSLITQGQIADAMALVEANKADAEALGDESDAATAVAGFWEAAGNCAFRAAQDTLAVEWCDRSLALAERLRADRIIAQAIITKGSAMVNLGRYREGIALLQGAVVDARAHGQQLAALRAGLNIAANTVAVDPRTSLAWTLDGIATGRRLGIAALAPYHAGNVSSAIFTGDWGVADKALDEIEDILGGSPLLEWVESSRDILRTYRGQYTGGGPDEQIANAVGRGDPQALANALSWAMDWAMVRGDVTAALAYARRSAMEVARTTGRATPDAVEIGRVALHAGDAVLVEEMIGLLDGSPGGALDGDEAVLRAGLFALRGDTPAALESFRSAMTIYRELGLRWAVAIVGLDMAALLDPGIPAVASAAAEAREVFTELGAAPFLEKLDRLSPVSMAGRQGG